MLQSYTAILYWYWLQLLYERILANWIVLVSYSLLQVQFFLTFNYPESLLCFIIFSFPSSICKLHFELEPSTIIFCVAPSALQVGFFCSFLAKLNRPLNLLFEIYVRSCVVRKWPAQTQVQNNSKPSVQANHSSCYVTIRWVSRGVTSVQPSTGEN